MPITPVNTFYLVSMTPVIRFFYSVSVDGNQFAAGVNDIREHFLSDVIYIADQFFTGGNVNVDQFLMTAVTVFIWCQ